MSQIDTRKIQRLRVPAIREFRKPKKDPTKELHQVLDETELLQINELFNQEEGKRMSRARLKEVLAKVAKIEYPEDVFERTFLKINSACNGFVTWNELISHLILGFEQQEVSTEYKTLSAPIPVSPNMIKSNHRHPINRITFYPTVKPDRTSTWHDGSIITCSHDGVINYWTLDMTIERTVQSTCPNLKIQTTWVTDLAVLPDLSVICTSSSERDLRFYDTSARKFELRVILTSLEHAVTTMHYKFYQDPDMESKLILGDMGGGVKVLFIKTFARGPFKSQPGIPLLHARWEKIVKGLVDNFRAVVFPHLHTDYVRQINFYSTLHSVVSCAQCPKSGLLMTDVTNNKVAYTYKIISGVWCFALEETSHIVATGSPDCLIRLWNPFVPRRPTCTFYGHHSGIVQLVFQDNGKKLYSLSKDKCVKVWDISLQVCLQTYLELPSELGERSELAALYNPESRQWIIGSCMIVVIPLSPKQSSEHTDGNTHSSGVSVVLYNKLFKVIVTCGLDSYIIVWNPWDGRRLMVIKEGHTRMLHGEIMNVEITAATFDPGYQRLLTGAHDGTLKIWNFNTGTCVRNMNIETWCEVQCVIWVKNRIMAMGWNKRVTEFADTGAAVGPEGAFSKNWDLRHSEDISAGAVRIPETLATSSYVGELLLWRLETGQPYKKFIVSNPTERIKIHFTVDKAKERKDSSQSNKVRGSVSIRQSKPRRPTLLPPQENTLSGARVMGRRAGRLSTIQLPEECFNLRRLAVHSMLFLCARKNDPQVGTLLVALENGVVQVWNHHVSGGFITSFSAVHKAGDYVISMTTDDKNEFLFIGTSAGYIKTWLLVNYCVLPEDVVHICMPKYRLLFPFMWGDRFVGRAKRMITNQPLPVLLNSYKGHFMPVSGLTFIEDCQILISCSADLSARMWTIGGRYLQTIGTFKPWKNIVPENTISDDFDFSIPPDIKRIASSTTLRVLCGGSFPKRLTIKQLQKQAQKDLIHIDHSKIYGARLKEPILGEHYDIPVRTTKPKDIKFDTTFPYIPVYQHLVMPQPNPIKVPDVPENINTDICVEDEEI
ncbi:WD repeat-containing protein on Y chromosome-like [Rhynchophorus ferrugineus]|uniref:WD repeat-containing protein on Y chromosome-like n=1 Tax=Rhynchophorus ferrugineus TaxID=354439 RepID=UPI003FCD6753